MSYVVTAMVVMVKSTLEISQKFVAFSEYMNFNMMEKEPFQSPLHCILGRISLIFWNNSAVICYFKNVSKIQLAFLK